MKLRLQSNSVRLRLKQGEVRRLLESGWLEEKIILGPGFEEVFHYALEACPAIASPCATLNKNGILVQVPTPTMTRWATGNEVGIEATVPIEGRPELRVIVEKDFACLNDDPEQNADAFPNPLAGTKC